MMKACKRCNQYSCLCDLVDGKTRVGINALIPATCDKCGRTLDSNCVEYGNGDSGYICADCYASLADDPRGEGER